MGKRSKKSWVCYR